MTRIAAGVALATVVLATLTGCGTSPYCQAVEDHQVELNTLGEKRTNAAYVTYARAFRTVANLAPTDVRKDWAKLADVTQAVVTAQQQAGIKLEEMLDESKLTKIPPDRLKALNNAYEAFNDTADERKAVVKNVKDECQITLS